MDTEDIGALADAGLTLLGENRAQQLEEKVAAWPDHGLRWHFIGQLQSRKVKTILPLVELIHSVASDSALAQLAQARRRRTRRSSSRSTSRGRRGRPGSRPPSSATSSPARRSASPA